MTLQYHKTKQLSVFKSDKVAHMAMSADLRVPTRSPNSTPAWLLEPQPTAHGKVTGVRGIEMFGHPQIGIN